MGPRAHIDNKQNYQTNKATLLEAGQTLLDLLGTIPVVGEVADLFNCGLYGIQGKKTEAGLSCAAAIPFLGWTAFAIKRSDMLSDVADKIRKATPAGAEKVLPRLDSFEQARNLALELLGEIDPATRQPYVGRLETARSTYGKVVGFTTYVNGEFKRFRMDYDPVKGPHVNVERGKGGTQQKWAIPWKGTEGDFVRIFGGNS
jgi:hypothetical protein